VVWWLDKIFCGNLWREESGPWYLTLNFRFSPGADVPVVAKPCVSRSRIYYSVTPVGSHRLADLSETWANLAAAIQKMLTGGQHGEAIP